MKQYISVPCMFSFSVLLFFNYLRQLNGVNDRDIAFVQCVCVCTCVQQTGLSDPFKMVKAMDFKSDVHISRHSPEMIL